MSVVELIGIKIEGNVVFKVLFASYFGTKQIKKTKTKTNLFDIRVFLIKYVSNSYLSIFFLSSSTNQTQSK